MGFANMNDAEVKSFEVKDSGKRIDFETGARRDVEDGKPRVDFISPHLLTRLGLHLAKGAAKYGAWNYTKGIPMSRCRSSLMRHAVQVLAGDTDEDHLSAVVFNAMCLMHYEAEIAAGRMDASINDLDKGPIRKQETATPVTSNKSPVGWTEVEEGVATYREAIKSPAEWRQLERQVYEDIKYWNSKGQPRYVDQAAYYMSIPKPDLEVAASASGAEVVSFNNRAAYVLPEFREALKKAGHK